MTRALYGASSADFAVAAVTVDTQVGVLILSPGVVMNVYNSISGSQVTDLLAATGATYTQDAAITTVTSLSNGTIPFYGPDLERGTLYLRASDGAGGYYWYAVNPTNLGNEFVALDVRVDTLEAGGGTGGSVTSGNITDSTLVGRQVLTASTDAIARSALGAGTGDSDLALGTTATTAAAGNHTHAEFGTFASDAEMAAKVDSGSGPFTIYRVTTAGGALPTGTIADGSICIRPNA